MYPENLMLSFDEEGKGLVTKGNVGTKKKKIKWANVLKLIV